MKTFSIILYIVALAIIVFNATKLNTEALFEGESMVAVIGIVAALCAILLVLIYNTSKKVEQKIKERR